MPSGGETILARPLLRAKGGFMMTMLATIEGGSRSSISSAS
jgi:hypothetical protein